MAGFVLSAGAITEGDLLIFRFGLRCSLKSGDSSTVGPPLNAVKDFGKENVDAGDVAELC